MRSYPLRHRQDQNSSIFADFWRSLRRMVVPFFLSALATFAVPATSVASPDDYILGPQDTLKIRVYEWRPSTGTAFEWVPLTGEFVISPAGNLSLPIIGIVPVAGKTLEQAADSISEKLQMQIGLQKRPNASVEVSEYRPFFVAGLVTKPGKYNYSPGLTVIQALSMAGGIGPVDPNLISLQRDALISHGDMRELGEERLGLLARKARVEATLKGAETVTFPPEVMSRKDEADVMRMMVDEQALFETRERSMNTELDSLRQAKVLAASQIESLQAKAVSLSKQIELANKEVNSVNKLIAQGLTISSRELSANQNLAELEGRNLDVSLAILKTQQDIAKVDQDTADVHNRYHVNALTEAAELRDRLAANGEKTRTAQSLINNLQVRAPAAMATADTTGNDAFLTTIDRNENGIVRTLIVADNDRILPGDVLRVEKRDRKSALQSNATFMTPE
ncbi:polysaccharide biosynthesis/export family protein [Rhizobium mesoamericanum]|uniref:Exopolysaccharide biosynthesis protein (OMA family outer membrane saccharide export protein) n=1 Tax=Rhizobium mesoamericanum STM3625 TaxID=1211777 RepID=K0Q4W5_9HYPH|nr:Exopolysaccharide biosynthesis protein (OMA family outer membrane saccharide export protein) [Rhizobium mesoamericanum STM3625]